MYRRLSAELENKNEMDSEDVRLSAQKGPLRDKYCQTDHHHHGCCETAQTLEPGDPPLLQKPMQTARSGILQIIECFRSGTKQLKQMLLKEVDTIFECKSCRSLFRGLPNLITHKQFYCLSKLHVEECPSTENDKPAQEKKKDLLETIYPRADKSELVIQLEPIQTNKNAVFQFVTTAAEISTGNCNPPDPGEIQMTETISSTAILAPQTEVNELPPSANCKKEPSSSIPVESPVQALSIVSKSVKTGSSSHPFSCRVCKKNFTCRRGIRRHIKKVHRKKLEDIKKFIEVHRIPTLSKGRKRAHTTSSKSCHMCQKSFATKANVRRHIDEVHKGMRRDSSLPEGTAKPGKNLAPEKASSKKSAKSLSRTQKPSGKSDFSLSSCKCPYCKRRYTSRYLLKKHVHIVHKAMVSAKDSKQDKEQNHAAHADVKVKIESSSTIEPSTITVSNLSNSELKGAHSANEKKITAATQKSKIKPDVDSLKASPNDKKKFKKPKLSAGFDFKQLYCKLCKRQFTSKQNLTKHIELHTDGNTIYVKFYRCPLCSYETRRKRDVIRHITVVHKKSQRALVKITGNLESRAIKKPIDIVLDKAVKNAPQKEKSKQLTLKQEFFPSPNKKHNTGEASIEVKVTKSFSLLKCNKCGKAFAKKTDLDQHKRDHKANSNSLPMDSKTKGRSTRSKTLI
ncbi:zinc finger protein 800 isoform X2 [Xenopus laevis]|uniref:Zinc finger protein 800 isoform X2 n=1 Tax=Xenopus laevis TaxID=8355 RepID=A0A8J0V172_XENLA|nr:zinc finger protein 800 isoform X2 [Xenopus laevis]